MGKHLVQGCYADSTGPGIEPPTLRSVARRSTVAPPRPTHLPPFFGFIYGLRGANLVSGNAEFRDLQNGVG